MSCKVFTRQFILALTFLAFSYVLIAQSVHAETRTVTNTLDSGPGSLRQVVLTAESGDTVVFDTYVFSQPLTLTLWSQIEISHSITINGLTNNQVAPTFVQYATARALLVDAGSTVSLLHINIAGTGAPYYVTPGEGAIKNHGALFLISSNLSGNTAAEGSAISNYGAMTITGSAILSNSNYDDLNNYGLVKGGAIYNSGSLMIVSSDISYNASCNGSSYGICKYFSGNRPSAGAIDKNTGGIYNIGVAIVVSSSLVSNSGGVWGGAIYNGGVLIIADSLIDGNIAEFVLSDAGAGGIVNVGAMTVTSSVFSGNGAAYYYLYGNGAGAIYNSGTASVINSTLSANGNVAWPWMNYAIGGAIYNIGSLNLNSSTVAGNYAANDGGQIRNSGAMTLTNTIVAGNAIGRNCAGALTDGGHNLEDTDTCGFTATDSLSEINPNLGTLQINPPGIAIPTMALLFGSPAINTGDDATCPVTDERGVHRPIGPHCDIGAYEAPYMVLLVMVMRQ